MTGNRKRGRRGHCRGRGRRTVRVNAIYKARGPCSCIVSSDPHGRRKNTSIMLCKTGDWITQQRRKNGSGSRGWQTRHQLTRLGGLSFSLFNNWKEASTALADTMVDRIRSEAGKKASFNCLAVNPHCFSCPAVNPHSFSCLAVNPHSFNSDA